MMIRSPRRGFSLVELMVTIAVIAVMLALAVPSLGKATKTARERGVVKQMVQDFTWARGAAGAADASSLPTTAALSGAPTVTLTLYADCHWTTAVASPAPASSPVAAHSMSTTQVTTAASGCIASSTSTPALTFPLNFTFSPQGFVTTQGTSFLFTGQSGQTFPVTVLLSGSIIQGSNAS